MGEADPHTFDALDVLTRAGDERDAMLERLDDPDPDVDLDALLVSDVLRGTGRVGDALATRHALVELCALLRAIDAAVRGRIDLEELRAGLALHATRTDRFAAFHDARVLLRTLEEVLDPAHVQHDARATRAQVELLDRELRAWAGAQLVGTLEHGAAASPSRGPGRSDPRTGIEVTDDDLRRRAHEHVDELLHGADHHPVTGLLGAAWKRDWSAVPVAGDRAGDDPSELERLLDTVAQLLPGVTHLIQIERRRPPRWVVDGRRVTIGDGLRCSWMAPATTGPRGAQLLFANEDRQLSVLTTADLDFAIVDGIDHHAVLGPAAVVEHLLGMPPLHAIARFREHVESLADEDGEPPSHLAELATRFGRLRRRAR